MLGAEGLPVRFAGGRYLSYDYSLLDEAARYCAFHLNASLTRLQQGVSAALERGHRSVNIPGRPKAIPSPPGRGSG